MAYAASYFNVNTKPIRGMTEELKNYILAQFEKNKPKLLKTIAQYSNHNNVSIYKQVFLTDQGKPVIVDYHLRYNKFTFLHLEVYANEEIKSETIEI